MSKRDTYIGKTQQHLDELNTQIAAIEDKAKAARSDLHDKLQLESKAALAKLDEIRQASESGWHALVSEMEKLRGALAHSFHYFKSQL